MKKAYIFFLIALFKVASIFQVAAQNQNFTQIPRQFNEYNNHHLQEKLFIHIDKNLYLAGETLWLKAYNVDAGALKPLDLSKVAYIEVIDQDKKAVLQTKIGLNEGTGAGSCYLPLTLNSGNYIIRGYTNWMKNFSPDFYFQKQVTIINTFKPLGLAPGDYQQEILLDFFPEGGALVNNIESTVAFKISDKNGKGISLSGAVVDAKNDTLLTFQPHKFGIGRFKFTPNDSTDYFAVIEGHDGQIKKFKMPAVQKHGYVMSVTEKDKNLIINIASNIPFSDFYAPSLYLLAHNKQEVKIAEVQKVKDNSVSFIIDKQALGNGITHLTIFDQEHQPVCERLVFNKPSNLMKIDASTNSNSYFSRKKVDIVIDAKDNNGPALANMSMSVYLSDSLQPEDEINIENYFLFTSDLQGHVESPDYYFSQKGESVDLAIDNLMLTHGWRKFKWNDILNQDSTHTSITYFPEYNGHVISGKLTTKKTGAAVANHSFLLSVPGKKVQLYSSRTDNKGKFSFEVKNLDQASQIVLSTNTPKDSVLIQLDNPFSSTYGSLSIPAFDINEGLNNQVLTESINLQVQNSYYEIERNKFTSNNSDSLPFYRVPDHKYLLDDYTRFTTLEEVMREYVPQVYVRKRKGKFHFFVLNSPAKAVFDSDPLVLLDGLPIYDIDKMLAYDPLKIQKLEIVSQRYFLGPFNFSGIVSYTTYNGDLLDFELDPSNVVINYEGLQSKREFFSPVYENPEQVSSRMPDFRNVLYWNPEIKTNANGKAEAVFFTSDQPGKYRVVIQGISKNGQPGYKTFTFDVKSAL